MAVPLETVVKQLSESGIIAPAKLENFIPPKAQPKDTDELVAELVKHNHLTRFQAAQVAQGKSKALLLGGYVILDKIGAGGMGQVFKAEHRRMKRLVAIKMLPSSTMKDPAVVARFQREVEAAAKLRHSNIVAADDADEANGVHFLVMEFVDGQDLSALLKQNGPFAVNDAIDYILQAARGLAYAHGEGVVHRDIKPANLLLDKKGVVKILDMGLARFEDASAADQQLTNTGAVMGTVDYMAPEQATDTRLADARSDVYSLGCSLYRILTGESVFEGDTVVRKIMAHMHNPIPSLPSKRPDVPAEIDRVFQKMLAKNPAQRYQTAAEVVAELEIIRVQIRSAALSETGLFVGGSAASSSYLSRTVSDEGATEAFGNQRLKRIYSPEPTMKGSSSDLAGDTFEGAARIKTAARTAGNGSSRGPGRPLLIAAAGGAAFLLIALGVWAIIRDPDGKEVARVEATDGMKVQPPPGGSVEIRTTNPNVPAPAGGGAPPLKPAARLEIKPLPSEVAVSKSTTVNPASKSTTVSAASTAAPPLAVAPFDAKQARAHQEAWANYLGTPVESTNSIGMKLVVIPPGEFMMGSAPELINSLVKEFTESNRSSSISYVKAEGPQHRVTITRPFVAGAAEITVGQFAKFVTATKYVTDAEKLGGGWKSQDAKAGTIYDPEITWRVDFSKKPWPDDTAVTQITWADAATFCNWLSEQEKLEPVYQRDSEGKWTAVAANGYRMPTEAEWEYVCRAGTTTQFWFGDDATKLAEHEAQIKATSLPKIVAQKVPSPFGLLDMHSNVRELCQDDYSGSWYRNSPAQDPTTKVTGNDAALRGGSFSADNTAVFCRSAARYHHSRESRLPVVGFRVVRGASVATTPPLAVAPFDAQQARAHQEAWAKYLGTPVESTNSIGMKLVVIPPGEFMMGSTEDELRQMAEVEMSSTEPATREKTIQSMLNESPQHAVRLTRPWLIATCETTVGQFEQFVKATGYQTSAEKSGKALGWKSKTEYNVVGSEFNWRNVGYPLSPEHPVGCVGREDATTFCNWLSAAEKLTPAYRPSGKGAMVIDPSSDGYRLPTEAEWEFACRAGTTTLRYWGDSIGKPLTTNVAYSVNGYQSIPVASRLANPFGLFDILGNAGELCEDWYAKSYQADAAGVSDPQGPAQTGGSFPQKTIRGLNAATASTRSAFRASFTSRHQNGFRVVRSIAAGTTVPTVAATASATTIATSASDAKASADSISPDRRAAEWVLSRGGTVTTMVGKTRITGIATVDKLPAGEFELHALALTGKKLTDDDLENLRGTNLHSVNLQTNLITSAGVEKLVEHTELTQVIVPYNPIDDRALAAIKRLPKLNYLDVDSREITNDGLKDLAQIKGLKTLSIGGPKLTDEGLVHLFPLTGLTKLIVKSKNITPAGIEKLQKALPKCSINQGAEEKK